MLLERKEKEDFAGSAVVAERWACECGWVGVRLMWDECLLLLLPARKTLRDFLRNFPVESKEHRLPTSVPSWTDFVAGPRGLVLV